MYRWPGVPGTWTLLCLHVSMSMKILMATPDRFELKDGEFGKGEGDKRSVASEITADHIQFVPAVPGKSNSFRFERQPNNTWRAVLDWPAKPDRPARQKIYIM